MIVFDPSQQSQNAIEDGEGVGRTARNVKVDGQDRVTAVVLLGVIDEGTAADRAGSHRNHEFRGGRGGIGFFQSQFHVLRHRTGHD